MGLLSFFKRRADAASNAAGSGEPAEMVQQARIRARQRLIGAAVLVVIGVIGFPLVFETQPRPIPVDIPIDIPRKEGAAPLPTPTPSVRPAPAAPAAVAAAPRDDVITETRSEAGREVTATAAPASTVVAATEAAPAKPKPATEPAKKPVPVPPAAPAEAVRAKALLDGAPPVAKTDDARFVVQVGAFSEVVAARETRLKVEKLGLKTYTQVAQTAAGSRIRVRVGPFASREEADKAMAKARAAGITAVVLTL
jgi:DedD protein